MAKILDEKEEAIFYTLQPLKKVTSYHLQFDLHFFENQMQESKEQAEILWVLVLKLW